MRKQCVSLGGKRTDRGWWVEGFGRECISYTSLSILLKSFDHLSNRQPLYELPVSWIYWLSLFLIWRPVVGPPHPPREPSLFSSIALKPKSSYSTLLYHLSAEISQLACQSKSFGFFGAGVVVIQHWDTVREKTSLSLHASVRVCIPRGNLHPLATLFIASFPFPC